MKLRYRGNSYEFHSHIETVGSTIIVLVRGLSYQIRHPLLKDYAQPQMNLRYRGIPYTTTSQKRLISVTTPYWDLNKNQAQMKPKAFLKAKNTS